MNTQAVILGFVSLIMWAYVWYNSKSRSPFGWASPTSIFVLGLVLFYIIPSLYWQFRPWTFMFYDYFDGLSLVFTGTIVFCIPFVINVIIERKNTHITKSYNIEKGSYGNNLYIILVPLAIGIGWRIFLVTLGWQGRLERSAPSIFGSESLALIIQNFGYYYPVCYFLLIAYGNRMQNSIGKYIWVFDGFFVLFIMSRTMISRYVLISLVFMVINKSKVSKKQWVLSGLFIIFLFSVIGMSQTSLTGNIAGDKKYVNPEGVVETLSTGTKSYYEEGFFEYSASSTESNPFLRNIDDTMFRFYDARSLSATMVYYKQNNCFLNGKSFLHIIYTFMPRYFWKDKPSLSEIHSITDETMYPETCNPLGTIGELYCNFGFLGVFIGGIVCMLLCSYLESYIRNIKEMLPHFICIYPLFTEILILSSFNFSQRIAEGIRAIMVMTLIAIMLKMI